MTVFFFCSTCLNSYCPILINLLCNLVFIEILKGSGCEHFEWCTKMSFFYKKVELKGTDLIKKTKFTEDPKLCSTVLTLGDPTTLQHSGMVTFSLYYSCPQHLQLKSINQSRSRNVSKVSISKYLCQWIFLMKIS